MKVKQYFKQQNILLNWTNSKKAHNYYKQFMNNNQMKAKLFIYWHIVHLNLKNMTNAKIMYKNINKAPIT